MGDRPKPALAAFFEGVAEIMNLDEGTTRLELNFQNGRLEYVWGHKKMGAAALERYDARAAWLIGVQST